MSKILKFLLLSFLLIFIIYKIIIYIKIDTCLDIGGAWDYPKNICITDKNISLNQIQCLSKKGTWDIKNKTCKY
jgi:hypothetical protein